MITNATRSASYGMQEALQTYNRAAARIADPITSIEIKDAVEIKQAEHQFKANAQVLAVSDRTTEHLINIIA